MKEILYNYDNLTEDKIDEVVIRTKALLINSKNEISLGYAHKTYQFPGGHLNEGETLSECLFREIKEETGIEIKNTKLKPFAKITYYIKDYKKTRRNRKSEIYYFIINTDSKFDINNTKFDDHERDGNYIVKQIPINDVENVLIKSIPDNPINKIIVEEMIEILKEYKNISNKKEYKDLIS